MVCRRAVLSWVGLFFVVMAAQVAVLPNVLAYEESRTEYGAPLRLASLPVRVRLDTPVPGFADGGNAALLRAIATWNARACVSPVLVLTEEDDGVLVEIASVREKWSFGSAIVAHTTVESEPFQGDIRHVVIEIDAQRKWSQDTVIASDAVDLESVFLHELGHALGLDHSRHPEAALRAGIKPGQMRRTLHADDIAGVCALTNKTAVVRTSLSAGDFVRSIRRSETLAWTFLLFVVGVCVVGYALGQLAWNRLRRQRIR